MLSESLSWHIMTLPFCYELYLSQNLTLTVEDSSVLFVDLTWMLQCCMGIIIILYVLSFFYLQDLVPTPVFAVFRYTAQPFFINFFSSPVPLDYDCTHLANDAWHLNIVSCIILLWQKISSNSNVLLNLDIYSFINHCSSPIQTLPFSVNHCLSWLYPLDPGLQPLTGQSIQEHQIVQCFCCCIII